LAQAAWLIERDAGTFFEKASDGQHARLTQDVRQAVSWLAVFTAPEILGHLGIPIANDSLNQTRVFPKAG
jgi:hypothetical protein